MSLIHAPFHLNHVRMGLPRDNLRLIVTGYALRRLIMASQVVRRHRFLQRMDLVNIIICPAIMLVQQHSHRIA